MQMNTRTRRDFSFCIRFIIFLLLLWNNLLATSSSSSDASIRGGNNTDRLALLAFKSMILHDPYGTMESWNDSLHFCQWQGVSCDNLTQRVTILDLPSRDLVGSLSPHIGNLSFLTDIRLQNNSLKGEIPPQIGFLFRLRSLEIDYNFLEGEIPSNLTRCTNLILLRLGGNELVGKIPVVIGSLSKLTALSIHSNHLTSQLPSSMGNISYLRRLSLGKNHLSGSIPNSFGLLKNLQALGLGENNLTGIIPSSIFNLTQLVVLSLAYNQLQGNLPQDVGLTLPNLSRLEMWKNQLTGSIPHSLPNASQLSYIALSNNRLTGKVPPIFGSIKNLWVLFIAGNMLGSGDADELDFLDSLVNCTRLKWVAISQNYFGGTLPTTISNLSTRLEYFAIEMNQINGVIPSGIGNLVNLEILLMYQNQLVGEIPESVGKIKGLRDLSLQDNRFSGTLPSSLGNLSLLSTMNLANNTLEGKIPTSLGNCQNLILLNLGRNNLTGTIPDQLFDASSLSISLNLSWNHFVGPLPRQIGRLRNLVVLDLSHNVLSGTIPSELGSCSVLTTLDMDSNSFHGPIPESLKALKGIQKLDLSQNNLSGIIPKYLEDFSFGYLNLSFNDFEGEIPKKGVFVNTSAISVTGNVGLCGGIPELGLHKCDVIASKRKTLHMKPLSIVIGCILATITIMSVFLFLWLRKKRVRQSTHGSFLEESFPNVSYEDLLKATDGFSTENLIGMGSFGTVYKGILNSDASLVAVKVLNLQRVGASKSFVAECEALRNIRHRNLVRTITACSSINFQGNEFKAIVYEFFSNGSLDRWLYSSRDTNNNMSEAEPEKSLNLNQKINIAIDVACAIDYLHNQCGTAIIHCDLKPNNILLDKDLVAHVGDFGLARFLPEVSNSNQYSSVGVRGTIGYAAPEYGLGSEVSTSGDVYSYGIMLLEMLTGKRPTDPMFQDGSSNLHHFAMMALPDRVCDILEPSLLEDDTKQQSATETGATGRSSPSPRISVRGGDGNNRKRECLISLVRIGVACSMETPKDRMEISDVIHELLSVKSILQDTCTVALAH